LIAACVVGDGEAETGPLATIDRLPQAGAKGIYLKQQLKDKLVEHKQYIDKYGEDLPEIRNWKWSANT
jgi:xylulose-5-phosphate/fructose-6-phosphate phosphoketolase